MFSRVRIKFREREREHVNLFLSNIEGKLKFVELIMISLTSLHSKPSYVLHSLFVIFINKVENMKFYNLWAGVTIFSLIQDKALYT